MDISRRRLVQAVSAGGAGSAAFVDDTYTGPCKYYFYRFAFPWRCAPQLAGFGKSPFGEARFGGIQ